MPSAALSDEAIWGLPGAKVAETRKGAETFCETPLLQLLRQGASHDPDALLLAEALPFRYSGPALMLADILAAPDRIWRPDAMPDSDAPFSVHMTSGSSGRPKGIVLSARSV